MTEKKNCCGNSLDLSKFGTCPFCITLAFLGAFVFWSLFFYLENFWLRAVILIWASSFSIMMIAHLTVWFFKKVVKKQAV